MPLDALAFATEDAKSGRERRRENEFFDESGGGFAGYCQLCAAGPFTFRGQRNQHRSGSKHKKRYQLYLGFYDEAVQDIKQEKVLLDHGRRAWAFRQDIARPIYESPFWCGDLSLLKAALFDSAFPENPSHGALSINEAFTKHVRHVQADLLLLSYVKVHLESQFGSVDAYREHCVLHHDLGILTSASSSRLWKRCLCSACEGGCLFLSLVMPWVTDVRVGPATLLYAASIVHCPAAI